MASRGEGCSRCCPRCSAALAVAALAGVLVLSLVPVPSAPVSWMLFHMRFRCPLSCWERQAKASDACTALADCAGCIFCQWGVRGACSADKVLRAFSRAECPGAAPGGLEGGGRSCNVPLPARPSRKQQLQGEVLDWAFRSLCLARQLKASRGQAAVANMLSFSLGYDSPFWLALNPNGTTVFVEDSAHWVKLQPDKVKEAAVVVRYSTELKEADAITCNSERLGDFMKRLPARVTKTCWDVILVDAPMGFSYSKKTPGGWPQPGRMQSIYAAAQLAGPTTTVFVDDCQRHAESLYTIRHLSMGTNIRVMSNGHLDDGHSGYTCMIYPLAT